MKKLNSKLGLFLYAIILTGLIFTTPLIAGLLNSFNPGETISSSEVNENFLLLQQNQDAIQDQLNNLCELPGQIIFNGITESGTGDTISSFTCDDIQVTTSSPETGRINVVMDGITTPEVVLQVTPRPPGTNLYNCNSNPNIDPVGFTTFQVNCYNTSNNSLVTSPLNLTLFRI